MSAELNNVAATAAFQVLPCPATRRLRVSISNGAIYLQRAKAEVPGGQPAWGSDGGEKLMLPQVASYDVDCDAVRFRWVVAPTDPTKPPRVSIDAATAAEVGE